MKTIAGRPAKGLWPKIPDSMLTIAPSIMRTMKSLVAGCSGVNKGKLLYAESCVPCASSKRNKDAGPIGEPFLSKGWTGNRRAAHSLRLPALALCLTILASLTGASVAGEQAAPKQPPAIRFVSEIPDAHFPELLYWFLTPETMRNKQYLNDVEHITRDTPFTFTFLTPRNGTELYSPETHAAIAALVADAHRHGLKVGIQLLFNRNGTAGKQDCFANSDPNSQAARSRDLSTISEAEIALDSSGQGSAVLNDRMRSGIPLESHLLRVYAFQKTGDGEYKPGSLRDITSEAREVASEPGAVTIQVRGGSELAGMSAYIMAENTYNSVDMFSDAFIACVHRDIDFYADVPLDGTALDEFGYSDTPQPLIGNFRDRLAGKAFAATFERETGMNFTETLFNMRYSPVGHPEVRIRAIDLYWDHLRNGPLRIEEETYRYSRQVLGNNIFAGIHDTFHNHLANDEAWTTGINWWRIPRQYGQSDEDTSLPVRMGLLVSHPGAIMYDQFYGFNMWNFAVKAMHDALYNARLHYHGYNDTGRWGADLSGKNFLSIINPVEEKIRLLNQFDPAAPELPLLIVFGMPAQLNWYPDEAARNAYDLSGSLDIETKANAVWDAGYRCALVPSDLIDSGALTLDSDNRPTLNGHKFKAIIYLYPEYSTQRTIAFLDQYSRAGGHLMTEGTLTHDFLGRDATRQWSRISARVTLKNFEIDKIAELGIAKDGLDPGCSSLNDRSPQCTSLNALEKACSRLEDGSMLCTDLDSLKNNQPQSFEFKLAGHIYTGSFVGVVALKTDSPGHLEKFACGQCNELRRDQQVIVSLKERHDLILTTKAGKTGMLIQGTGDTGDIKVRP